jgi:uncharacterized protein YybS (DUF2232 family)
MELQGKSVALDLVRGIRAGVATTALFLSGFFLPFGGPLLMLLTPQPGLRLNGEANATPRIIFASLVAVSTALLAGAAVGLAYVASFGLLTVILPLVLEREWSVEVTVGVTTAAVAIVVLAAALCFASPTELLLALRATLDHVHDQAVSVYGRSGLSPEIVRQLDEGSARLIDLVLRLTPALFLLSIAAVILVNLGLLRRSQQARGIAPAFGDLTRWKCPPELVWLLVASGYSTVLSGGVIGWFAANVFAVLVAVYFCQGLVIAQFYMRLWRSPLWVVGLVYAFIVVEWLVATAVTLVGVFDLWADFRRLNPRPAVED